MGNIISRKLLRPKSLNSKIRVLCVEPHSAQIFWALKLRGRNDEFGTWPNSVFDDGQLTYLLGNDQHRRIRGVTFDDRTKAIYNASSVPHIFSVDHTELAEVSEEERYDRNNAHLKEASGITYIRLALTGYDKVSAFLRLRLIEPLRIEPPSLTRYLHVGNTADYKIIDGSNDVRVSTNTSLISEWSHIMHK